MPPCPLPPASCPVPRAFCPLPPHLIVDLITPKYSLNSTNHEAPHNAVFSILLLKQNAPCSSSVHNGRAVPLPSHCPAMLAVGISSAI